MRISDWSSDVCSSDLDRGRAGAVAGHQLAGPSGRLRYRHHRHQGRCRNPARRARRNQEKRKEVVMNDKLELDIPVLLPDLPDAADACLDRLVSTLSKRSEEHTSELQSLMRISYAVFCLKTKNKYSNNNNNNS